MNTPRQELSAALANISTILDRRYDGGAALAIAAGNYILSVRELTGVNHYSTADPVEIIDRIMNSDVVHALAAQVDEIYKAYPRQRDPRLSKRAITAALADVDIPHQDKFLYLLTAVKLYANWCETNHKQPQYIPHSSTWMRRQSYLNAPKQVLAAMAAIGQSAKPKAATS